MPAPIALVVRVPELLGTGARLPCLTRRGLNPRQAGTCLSLAIIPTTNWCTDQLPARVPAGNEGDDLSLQYTGTVEAPATCKNVLAVGASQAWVRVLHCLHILTATDTLQQKTRGQIDRNGLLKGRYCFYYCPRVPPCARQAMLLLRWHSRAAVPVLWLRV
jgi:hypothetical protein